MNRNERIASLAIVVLAVAIVAVAVYDFSSSGQKNNISTNSFVQQPVVDMIVPSLFRQSSEGGVNAILNLTAGQSKNLTVEVYPIKAVNLSMEFRYFPLTIANVSASQSGGSLIAASFSPSTLTIKAEGEGNFSVLLSVSGGAASGLYTLVLSTVNLRNASQVWGITFTANLTGPT